MAAYNYLQRRVTSLLSGTEVLSKLVLAYVADDARGPRAAPALREVQGGVPSGGDNGGLIQGINVTPLVDVMLVLLVIFVVTAKIIVTPAVPLDLPHAAHGEEVQVVLSIILPVRGPMLVNGAAVTDDADFESRARSAFAGESRAARRHPGRRRGAPPQGGPPPRRAEGGRHHARRLRRAPRRAGVAAAVTA